MLADLHACTRHMHACSPICTRARGRCTHIRRPARVHEADARMFTDLHACTRQMHACSPICARARGTSLTFVCGLGPCYTAQVWATDQGEPVRRSRENPEFIFQEMLKSADFLLDRPRTADGSIGGNSLKPFHVQELRRKGTTDSRGHS